MSTDPTPIKSCELCPAFVAAVDTPGRFGRSTGSPMCGRFGKVLGKPGATPKQEATLRKQIASSCLEYGNSMPPSPKRDMYVMFPDDMARVPSSGVAADTVTSCAMCKNFIPEHVVANEVGWTTGMCAARGKLLLTNRLSTEAKNCEYRSFGSNRVSTSGMTFLPEYDSAFLSANEAAVRSIKESVANAVDPGEYESDREITDDDKAVGIRAWRRVADPEDSERAVFFPIYEPTFFSEDLQKLIPKTGSDEHPELYVDHFGGLYGLGVAWMELDETPAMWGMAGVGKTELFRYAAWIMQVPYHRLSVTKSMELDDIAGKMLYSPDKGTYFEYGRLPKAWTSPGVLCIDEPNVGPPEVWQFIRPLTDNSKQLVLDMNEGETLDRHPDCYMGMAMNPAWDPRNVGALEVADADVNRLFHTYLDMPPEELEREIIQARVRLDGWELSAQQLDAIMATAKAIRSLSEAEELSITWAIRPQIKVARALRWFSPQTAYRRAIGDFLEPEAMRVLADQVNANWPGDDVPF